MCDSVNVSIKIKRSDGCSAVKKIESKFHQEVVFRRNYKKKNKSIIQDLQQRTEIICGSSSKTSDEKDWDHVESRKDQLQ